MNPLISLYNRTTNALDSIAPFLLSTLARLVFAGVLLGYYWNSGLTKLGPGMLGFLMPSDGAYIQIFPRTVEAFGYDFSQLTAFHWLVVVAGTWAEFLLPLFIVIGLLTRLSALGMIGFIVMQSVVDVLGHGASVGTIGAWFDRASDALILDQRAFWVLTLIILVLRGGGPLSVDAFLRRRLSA
jgi:putative oxidoreductase